MGEKDGVETYDEVEEHERDKESERDCVAAVVVVD